MASSRFRTALALSVTLAFLLVIPFNAPLAVAYLERGLNEEIEKW